MGSQSVMVVSSVRTGLYLRSKPISGKQRDNGTTVSSPLPKWTLPACSLSQTAGRESQKPTLLEMAVVQSRQREQPWLCAGFSAAVTERPLSLQHRNPGGHLFSRGPKKANRLLIRPWMCLSEWKDRSQQSHWPRHLPVSRYPS